MKNLFRKYFSNQPELAAMMFAMCLFILMFIPPLIIISFPAITIELHNFVGRLPPIIASLLGGVTIGVWGLLAFPGLLLTTLIYLYYPGIITPSTSAIQSFFLISLVSSVFWACLVYGIEQLSKQRLLTKKEK